MRRTGIVRGVIALAVGAALALPAYASAAEVEGAGPVSEVTTTNGCLASVPEPGSTEPVQICYSIHRPAGSSAQAPVPMMMTSHGWGGSRGKLAGPFTAWLKAGFGVLSFDQRGFGESGGFAHVEHPDFEGQDVIGLVDLVATLDWVSKDGPNDPVLGAFGGSYGGGFQFAGALTEVRDTGSTRFNALSPSHTWWDVKESIAPQEVVRTVWQTGLYSAGREDVAPEFNAGFAYLTATGNWPGTGDFPLADLDAFFLKNGPAWHVSQGRRLDIPVMFDQGITDNLFNLNQGLKSYDNALTDAARAQSILVADNTGHNLPLPDAVPPGYPTTGSVDPCSAALGGGNLTVRFMQEKLKGLDTGLTGYGQYHLATADGACLTLDSARPDTDVALGIVPVSAAAGAPVAHKLLDGPVTIAGQPLVKAAVTTAGVESRAFFALSIGTSPADAKVIAGNVMPLNVPLPGVRRARSFELPAVAIEVPAGKSLFLTASPVSDQFPAHGSRTPGAMLLEGTTVQLPVVDPVPPTPVAASDLVVTAPSEAPVSGDGFDVTVTATNADGTTDKSWTGTPLLTTSDGHATLPSCQAAAEGVATCSGVVLGDLGAQTLTATDGEHGQVSAALTVQPTGLRFDSAPDRAKRRTDTVYTTAPTVGVSGASTDGYRGTQSISTSDASDTVPKPQSCSGGSCSFTVQFDRAGKHTVTVQDDAGRATPATETKVTG